MIDTFDSLTLWRTNPAAGVEVGIHADSGVHGRAMRVDFDFHGHQGYWIVHRDLALDLPPNYRFTFALRADAPTNNLEFKLVDEDGSSVWWSRRINFAFPRDWQKFERSKREICYGWGQIRGNSDTRHISAIEFAISTGTGGKGSVWIDDLTLTPLEMESPFSFTEPLSSNPLVGTWESAVGEKGGSGAKLDFEPVGTLRSVLGLMGPFRYSVDRDRLTTIFGDSTVAPQYTFTTRFRIDNDTYVQSGENLLGRDITMKRTIASRVAEPIQGVWVINDYSGATGFVAFEQNGKGELRIPTRSCSGTWKSSRPGHIAIDLNGEVSERDYSIEGDTLTVKSPEHDLKYIRRRR